MLNCRSCHSSKLSSIIPLGDMPLANDFTLTSAQDNYKRYNLEVMLCVDCGLAQLKDLVDPKKLFNDYVYFSSNSDTMLRSVRDLVKNILPTLHSRSSFVVEIASNDGYLLKNYVENGVDVLGIDPAQNIAEVANKNGINTLCDFFSLELAKHLKSEGKLADIIHANNVMAHVPDINDFIKGIKTLLKPNGQAIIEVPYLLDLVQNLEFDTIYHEHVYYFALKPLSIAFKRHGLHIFNLEKLSIHGGTLRLYIGHDAAHEENPIIGRMLHDEVSKKLFDLSTYEEFMQRLNLLKQELTKTLDTLKQTGKNIVAYGASAKGTTLLNYFNIGKYLDAMVDRSSEKQGKYSPGTIIKILPPSHLVESKASHALLLTWNFAEEILEQQKDFLQNGGKFIIPLPEVREIS